MYFADMVYRHLDLDKGSTIGWDYYRRGGRDSEKDDHREHMVHSSKSIDRPSISKAIEMLEGNLKLLAVPPKPSLSSPSVPPRNFERTSSSSTFTDSKSHQRQEPQGGESYVSVGKPVATCITSCREYDRQLPFPIIAIKCDVQIRYVIAY
ncbi:hypothetical protein NL676_028373 [Syzygium grande]|nr:hypothetical protein NL676_028373 [Syzygium grande]